MRRLPITVLSAAVLAVALLTVPAGAQTDDGSGDDAGVADVIEVSGWIDPVLADFVEDGVATAARTGSRAVVLQLNSPGSLLSDAELDALVRALSSHDIPIGVWVGPGSASAKGGAEDLLKVADRFGRAPGAEVAVDREIEVVPTIGDLIIEMPGVESREVEQGDQIRREPLTQVRFTKLDLLPRLMHTVASPALAYLLLLVGMVLIVFELYTAGIGVAGIVGAGSLVLAAYGLDVLPVNGVGLGLLVLSIVAFAVDVQTGVPRFWTAVGVVALVAGSLLLYDDPVDLGWLALLVGVVGTIVMMLGGMPSIVRSRFSTPTIGRESMIGEMGEAVQDIRPDGVVRVRDALWRAHTNRATPIAEGDPVRVVGIDGLLLEVEPEEGGARDYRERRARDRDQSADKSSP